MKRVIKRFYDTGRLILTVIYQVIFSVSGIYAAGKTEEE